MHTPVDGKVKLGSDVDGDYPTAVEFVGALPESRAFLQCFTQMWYRFALGRDGNAKESISFNAVRDELDDSRLFNSMVETFIGTESFYSVHTESENDACPKP